MRDGSSVLDRLERLAAAIVISYYRGMLVYAPATLTWPHA